MRDIHMRHWPDHEGPPPGVTVRWLKDAESLAVHLWTQSHRDTATMFLCPESARQLLNALSDALAEMDEENK